METGPCGPQESDAAGRSETSHRTAVTAVTVNGGNRAWPLQDDIKQLHKLLSPVGKRQYHFVVGSTQKKMFNISKHITVGRAPMSRTKKKTVTEDTVEDTVEDIVAFGRQTTHMRRP